MSVVTLPKHRMKAPGLLVWADHQRDPPEERGVLHQMRNDEGGRFFSVARYRDIISDPPGIALSVGSSSDDEEAGQ
jgi:hypothetical protein